jgi:hypothetical protein
MADVERHRKAAIARVLDGKGVATLEARRAAFDNRDVPAGVAPLIDKIANRASRITDEDVAAAKRAVSEDEVFELAVCAAIGQATRQLDAALKAIAEVEP